MNPARTLASDVPAMQYPSLWIYIAAPFIGMLGAAEVFVRRKGKAICAKMYHSKSYLCIFNCGRKYFLCGPDGIWVISPEGKYLGRIKAPEHIANMAWGDDGHSLYICASTSIYKVNLKTKGVLAGN